MQALGFHGNNHFQYCVNTVPEKLQNRKSVSHIHLIRSEITKKKKIV